MKVVSIDISVVDVPYIAPVRQVGWNNPPFVVVRVRTDEGLVGVGEAWGADQAAVERAAQAFVGKEPLALQLQTLEARFQSAFYDLAGQALGMPVWRLIGDRQRDRAAIRVQFASQIGTLGRVCRSAGVRYTRRASGWEVSSPNPDLSVQTPVGRGT